MCEDYISACSCLFSFCAATHPPALGRVVDMDLLIRFGALSIWIMLSTAIPLPDGAFTEEESINFVVIASY